MCGCAHIIIYIQPTMVCSISWHFFLVTNLTILAMVFLSSSIFTGRPLISFALIYWAKTGMRQFTMRYVVNDYLEACSANRPSIGGEETILAHRKIAANRLAIDCIYALSKEELSKVDRELESIVGDLPRQGIGIHR